MEVIGLAFKIDDFYGAKPKSEKDREAFAQIIHEKLLTLAETADQKETSRRTSSGV